MCYSQLASLVERDDGSEARRLVQEPDRLTNALNLALGGANRLQLASTHALNALLREDALQVGISSGKNEMGEAKERCRELRWQLELRLAGHGGRDRAITQIEVLERRDRRVSELCIVSIEAERI